MQVLPANASGEYLVAHIADANGEGVTGLALADVDFYWQYADDSGGGGPIDATAELGGGWYSVAAPGFTQAAVWWAVNAVNTDFPGGLIEVLPLERILNVLELATGAVADASPAATSFDTNLTEATDDHYNGAFLVFTSGANAGKRPLPISDYNGTTKVIAFASPGWAEAPADTDTFVIIGAGVQVHVSD